MFNPRDWAASCRAVFATRQPHLVDQVWDDVWNAVPYAYRVWVVSLKQLDRMGQIIIPDQAKRSQQEGWVVSVGPEAGTWYNGVANTPYNDALDLVGRRVFWGAYVGIDLVGNPTGIADPTAAPRNKVRPHQYLSLSVGDILGESLRTDGSIL